MLSADWVSRLASNFMGNSPFGKREKAHWDFSEWALGLEIVCALDQVMRANRSTRSLGAKYQYQKR
jgi:hypothetical protein